MQKRITSQCLQNSVRSWVAHSSYANTNGLRIRIFNELVKRNASFGHLFATVLMAEMPSPVAINEGRYGFVFKTGHAG